jgi:Mn-dependent DtxR family transcriptional regulator
LRLCAYEKYRGFSLTVEGRAVAARIKARHETLTELFGLLGLDPELVEQEVEDIEHHLRPQTLEVLARLVDYWKTHSCTSRGRSEPRTASSWVRFTGFLHGRLIPR